MPAKCLSYIVFVSCWGCYKCSMYYNYMHLGDFSLLFLMLSCTENWASVSERRQSQLLSFKPLFKVCKPQQILPKKKKKLSKKKPLCISLTIDFKIIMLLFVELDKSKAWMKPGGQWEPHACVCGPFPVLQTLLSNAPSPSPAPSPEPALQFPQHFVQLTVQVHFCQENSFYLSSNWSLIKDLSSALWFLNRNNRSREEQSKVYYGARKKCNWGRSSS